MDITSAQIKGRRPYQEDRSVVYVKSNGDAVLAVFDGHGGSVVSELAALALPKIFEASHNIYDIFTALDNLTANQAQGSTASIAVITSSCVNIGTLGDSPVAVYNPDNSLLYLNPEHNVRSNQEEAEAALVRGGTIMQGYLFNDYSDLAGHGIQMSRVLGDAHLRRVTSHTPEVSVIVRKPGLKLLLGTDGLLDPAHMSSRDSDIFKFGNMIGDGVNAEELVNSLNDPHDNVTAIIARF